MYSIIIITFGWKLCSKLNFITMFPILANFAAFLDHTKENADVATMMSNFRVLLYFKKVHA